jgi:hypothetical protein
MVVVDVRMSRVKRFWGRDRLRLLGFKRSSLVDGCTALRYQLKLHLTYERTLSIDRLYPSFTSLPPSACPSEPVVTTTFFPPPKLYRPRGK